MNRHGKRYPVKTSVNLLCREKHGASVLRTLAAVLVAAVALALFSKFAVVDRLAASRRALDEAEALEGSLAVLAQSNSDYEEVLREYQHYYFSASDNNPNESSVGGAYVDCQDVMELVDAELLRKAGIQMVNLTGNVLTVNLTKINLERASAIAKSLGEHKLVREVMVSAANKQQESQETTIYLNIILETERGADAEEDD